MALNVSRSKALKSKFRYQTPTYVPEPEALNCVYVTSCPESVGTAQSWDADYNTALSSCWEQLRSEGWTGMSPLRPWAAATCFHARLWHCPQCQRFVLQTFHLLVQTQSKCWACSTLKHGHKSFSERWLLVFFFFVVCLSGITVTWLQSKLTPYQTPKFHDTQVVQWYSQLGWLDYVKILQTRFESCFNIFEVFFLKFSFLFAADFLQKDTSGGVN